jgi:hypothetical protein
MLGEMAKSTGTSNGSTWRRTATTNLRDLVIKLVRYVHESSETSALMCFAQEQVHASSVMKVQTDSLLWFQLRYQKPL